MRYLFLSIVFMLFLGIFDCSGQALFRMKRHFSNDSYQVYVGKKVVFYEPVNKDEKKIRLKGIKTGRPYTIRSIRYREDNPIVEPMFFMDVTDDEYVNSPIVKIKCEPYKVDKIPMYFVDLFEDWKREYVGTEVAYPDEPYVVTDLIWEKTKILNDYYVNLPYVVYRGKETQFKYKELLKKELESEYVIELSRVEKPADETIRYGETSVVQGDQVTKYSYVDNVISLLVYGNKSGFFIELENISENSVRLVWNEAVFVNVNGVTCRVTHSESKLDGQFVDQTPSLIIKGAKLVDVVIPNDLEYDDKVWVVKDMFSLKKKYGEASKVSLMLPIQIKNTINEYILVFDTMIRWVHPELHTNDGVVDLYFDFFPL